MMSELIYTRSTVTQSLMRRRFTELERISFKLSLDLSEFSYYNYWLCTCKSRSLPILCS